MSESVGHFSNFQCYVPQGSDERPFRGRGKGGCKNVSRPVHTSSSSRRVRSETYIRLAENKGSDSGNTVVDSNGWGRSRAREAVGRDLRGRKRSRELCDGNATLPRRAKTETRRRKLLRSRKRTSPFGATHSDAPRRRPNPGRENAGGGAVYERKDNESM